MKKKKSTDLKSTHREYPWETLLLYSMSFLIPAVVMLLIFKGCGFYPFGEKSLFIMDMRDRYLEFYASLRNVLSGKDSLFFSWSRSMGGNYLGLFAYYIASPLFFITVFFSLKDMPSAILFLTVLKIGLSGLSFSFFGKYVWSQLLIAVYGIAAVLCVIAAVDLHKNGSAMFAGLEQEFGYCTVKDYEAFLDKTLPLVDSLFAVKYLIDDGMVPSNYSLLRTSQAGASLYENAGVLPIAYAASCKNATPDLDEIDPFANQNAFISSKKLSHPYPVMQDGL